MFIIHLIQGHQTASLGRLNFWGVAGWTSYRFSGQRTSTVSLPRHSPGYQHLLFFTEEKALALDLGRRAWSGATEIRRKFRLLVYAGRIELGLRQAWNWSQVGSMQRRAVEICCVESRTGEIGPGERGASEVRLLEVGIRWLRVPGAILHARLLWETLPNVFEQVQRIITEVRAFEEWSL